MIRPASQTALTTAAARAAHLIVDTGPTIFSDTLALALLGDEGDELVDYHRRHGEHPVLSAARALVVCRSRYTEDRVIEAAARGVSQYVILGAGLDTFAHRQATDSRLRVYEVDHQASQEDKRERLAAAGIAVPASLTHVPVDFETETVTEDLGRAGFDPSAPAVVSWLGVTMYLTAEAIGQTLAAVGRWAPGTELMVEYMLDVDSRDAAGQSYIDQMMPLAAQRGEPWLSPLAPADIEGMLIAAGFNRVRHVAQRDMVPAPAWVRSDSLRPARLSAIAHART
jgi:methyltransferase (TIGR00027 family)